MTTDGSVDVLVEEYTNLTHNPDLARVAVERWASESSPDRRRALLMWIARIGGQWWLAGDHSKYLHYRKVVPIDHQAYKECEKETWSLVDEAEKIMQIVDEVWRLRAFEHAALLKEGK